MTLRDYRLHDRAHQEEARKRNWLGANPLWAVCFIIGAAFFGEPLFDSPVAPKRKERWAQQCVGCGKYRPPHHPSCPQDRKRIDLRRARQRGLA